MRVFDQWIFPAQAKACGYSGRPLHCRWRLCPRARTIKTTIAATCANTEKVTSASTERSYSQPISALPNEVLGLGGRFGFVDDGEMTESKRGATTRTNSSTSCAVANTPPTEHAER